MKFFAFGCVFSFCLMAVTAKGLGDLHGDIKCLLDVALDARNYTQQFNNEAKDCSGEMDQSSQKLLDYMEDIAHLADGAILIYKSNCTGYKLIRPLCKSKLSVQIVDIGIKVVPTLKLILNITENPLDVNECVLKAALDIENKLDELLDTCKACISISL